MSFFWISLYLIAIAASAGLLLALFLDRHNEEDE